MKKDKTTLSPRARRLLGLILCDGCVLGIYGGIYLALHALASTPEYRLALAANSGMAVINMFIFYFGTVIVDNEQEAGEARGLCMALTAITSAFSAVYGGAWLALGLIVIFTIAIAPALRYNNEARQGWRDDSWW